MITSQFRNSTMLFYFIVLKSLYYSFGFVVNGLILVLLFPLLKIFSIISFSFRHSKLTLICFRFGYTAGKYTTIKKPFWKAANLLLVTMKFYQLILNFLCFQFSTILFLITNFQIKVMKFNDFYFIIATYIIDNRSKVDLFCR